MDLNSTELAKHAVEQFVALREKAIESLAAYAHEAWSGWMNYMFKKMILIEDCNPDPGGRRDLRAIPDWAEDRWKRQAATPYAELPEEEKKSDRVEAHRMLAIMDDFKLIFSAVAIKAPSYPRCPRCGGPVVGAMMTSRSVEVDGERYYHPDAISVYCESGDCNYDKKLSELPTPSRTRDEP